VSAELAMGRDTVFHVAPMAGGWMWAVTDTTIARIDPSSGRATAWAPGITTVIATSRRNPSMRGAATLRVRLQ